VIVALICSLLALTLYILLFVAPTYWSVHGGSSQNTPKATDWSKEQAPNYYQVVGPAAQEFSLQEAGTTYGTLDVYGRATYAEGCVSAEMMKEGIERPRGNMSHTNPTGWGSNEQVSMTLPSGDSYHGYFWNRSHLLAKSLGGDDDLHNLVTGTRMQNVGGNDGNGGMAYCETTCRDWLESHPNGLVHYRAEASYEGDELVPRSVFVDMLSSDGAIDQHVEVFNAAEGFAIDYANGTFASHDGL
jgi:DNA-entry nuclease